MLFQVGGQGTRPTFFEMAAAQQLPASLRAALTYSIGVLALRRPFLHKVLDYDDEFFAVLMMVLETHSLRTTEASFSESLYGLRRRVVKIKLMKDNPHGHSGERLHHSGLGKRQRVLSVAFLVVLPYFKSKLQSIYNKEREATLQASLWGPGDTRFDDDDYFDGSEASNVRTGDMSVEVSRLTCIRKKIEAVIGSCYPWIHAGTEGLSFGYQLLYLLDATGFYSPGLHALGIHVCRATGQELMDTSSRISRIRSHERDRLRGPPWLKAVQRVLLSCIYTSLDYAQTGLIAAVFFFKMICVASYLYYTLDYDYVEFTYTDRVKVPEAKLMMMEWWYQSAEERMSAPTVYPPPPPPPPPKVAEEGIPLSPDRTICPLCSQKRANPSVVAVSGFVFCYTCVFRYISQVRKLPYSEGYKRCPVTLIPATVDQIRRLFHDM
ncbi:hypothetical protein GIB67_030258 [Kingdonia uniflora]|uniref:Peroxin-12 n=1 Tax=Kingdonia uniflora TaxID=39325 RepID=A0A7J7MMS5_9MAGN|nr:hypothetical protein GIB67_030258 [Kingdonia uniflora]